MNEPCVLPQNVDLAVSHMSELLSSAATARRQSFSQCDKDLVTTPLDANTRETQPLDLSRIERFLRAIMRSFMSHFSYRRDANVGLVGGGVNNPTTLGRMFDSFMMHVLASDLTDTEHRVVRTALRENIGDFLRDCAVEAAFTAEESCCGNGGGGFAESGGSHSEHLERITDLCAFFKNDITISSVRGGGVTDDAAEFLRHQSQNHDDGSAAYEDVNYMQYEIFRTLEEERTNGAARRRHERVNDTPNPPPLRLHVDARFGRVSCATSERLRRPFVTPLSNKATLSLLRRESLYDHHYMINNTSGDRLHRRVVDLPTISRHDWNVKIRYLTDAAEANQHGSSGDNGGGGEYGIKRNDDRNRADTLRAKILNAYGRLAIIEPKFFQCKIQRI